MMELLITFFVLVICGLYAYLFWSVYSFRKIVLAATEAALAAMDEQHLARNASRIAMLAESTRV